MANEEGKQGSTDKQKNVYSYHTFMFPFIWQNKYNSDVTFSEFWSGTGFADNQEGWKSCYAANARSKSAGDR